MDPLKRLIRMSLALGILALVSMIFSVLALTDIYHNIEPDLSLEWSVLRITFLLMLMFIVLASVTILRLSRSKSN